MPASHFHDKELYTAFKSKEKPKPAVRELERQKECCSKAESSDDPQGWESKAKSLGFIKLRSLDEGSHGAESEKASVC